LLVKPLIFGAFGEVSAVGALGEPEVDMVREQSLSKFEDRGDLQIFLEQQSPEVILKRRKRLLNIFSGY
jgi:hypothetical protein